MILLDTHVLIWLVQGNERLGKQTRARLDQAAGERAIAVCSMVFWEVAMLALRGRIDIDRDASAFRAQVLSLGISEISVTGEIAITAAELPGFHGDPFDQLMVATALQYDGELATADEQILDWGSSLRRIDARR